MLPFDFYPVKEINTKNNPNSSSFIFHRLPRGMGVTVGNSLKRILHDYISGVAPIGVKIADRSGPVKVELSKLEGVKETTPFLILNLKEIIIEEKNLKEEFFCLELKVENKDKNKEVIITAADFQKDKNIEIKNPNLPLATLAVATDDKENPKLEIKLYCRKGWGFYKAEEQEKSEWWKKHFAKEEDVIALDTDYSPIKGGKVNFKVESVPVSLTKEEEKLELIINTNGAIKPKKALNEALEIAYKSFASIASLINQEKSKTAAPAPAA